MRIEVSLRFRCCGAELEPWALTLIFALAFLPNGDECEISS